MWVNHPTNLSAIRNTLSSVQFTFMAVLSYSSLLHSILIKVALNAYLKSFTQYLGYKKHVVEKIMDKYEKRKIVK